MKDRFSFLPSLIAAFFLLLVINYLLFLPHVPHWTGATLLIVLPAILFYPFILSLIPAAAASLAIFATAKKEKAWKWITGSILFLTIFPLHLGLLLDAGLFARYNYHINPHVLNIFTTPGGFAGMGLEAGEIALLAAGIVLLMLFDGGLIWGFMRYPSWSIIKIKSWKTYCIFPVCAGILFVIQYFTYAYSHFMMKPDPLLASNAIPFYITGTCKSLFESCGLEAPARDAVRLELAKDARISAYPQKPVRRNPKRKKFNVVWISCESFAARLFTPEIMPNTAKFAEKSILFTKHYSGGNVTRQGMFSMFYGLPGNYWHPFLAARRGPLFIDWLIEDGYQFECITSSKFTYPEFDQTIFFNVPPENMHEDFEGASFKRDGRNINRLLNSVSKGADSGKPFFCFMFFESLHHPYSFPKKQALYSDYIEPFNAVNTTAADGPAIFKRAANCAHYMDRCLGKLFALLEEKNLLENTIVVIAGDHGEEYYEKGHLGHSSVFNEEQTRTPLIIYYPGVKPQRYTGLSSHLDIIPMLAGFFGVENDPSDYSCGINLLAPDAPKRRYAIIANWDQVFFAGEKYKSLIPLDAASFAAQTVTDANDNELPEVDPFYQEYNADLIKVQEDLNRFTAPPDNEHSNTVIWIIAGVLLAAGAAAAGIIIHRKKKSKAAQC